MSTPLTIFTFAIPFVTIFLAVWAALRSIRRHHNPRRAMKRHLLTLVSVFVLMMAFSMVASAEGTAADAATVSAASQIGMGLLSAALAVGLGGLGGGIAIAGGAPAAIGATSEDSKAFGKALIFVALGEAVALYGFVIAFVILSKIPAIPALPDLV